MLFSDADRLLGRHEPSGPHGQVIRAVAARSLVSESQEGRHEPLSLLFGDRALPNAMHRGAHGHGVARNSKRFSVLFASTTVSMHHVGAAAQTWCSGLRGMHGYRRGPTSEACVSDASIHDSSGANSSNACTRTQLTLWGAGQTGTA